MILVKKIVNIERDHRWPTMTNREVSVVYFLSIPIYRSIVSYSEIRPKSQGAL